MTALLPPPFITALDINGQPISGATLTFYASGTTTLIEVYADADLQTALANPLTADAAGRFPAVYLPDDPVRVVLKDAGGATIRDTDPVNSVTGAGQISVDTYIPADELIKVRAGTSTANLSTYVQQAITAAGQGGIVEFGPGTYYVNIVCNAAKVAFRGQGINATILRPFSNASPVIWYQSGGTPYGQGQYIASADMSIVGPGVGTAGSVAIRLGRLPYVTGAELANYITFERVAVVDFDKGLERLSGNLETILTDCTFGACNYHFWSRSADPDALMHAGCFFVRGGEYFAAQIAHAYFRSITNDSGQVYYSGCKIQGNPGYLWFFDTFRMNAPVPTVVLDCVWQESNYTAASVGVLAFRSSGTASTYTAAPLWLYAYETAHIEVRNSPLGPYRLESNSTLDSDRCVVDFGNSTLTVVDATSRDVHNNVITESVIFRRPCTSWAATRRNSTAPSTIWMRNRVGTTKAWGTPLLSNDCTGAQLWTGVGTPNVTATTVSTDGTTFATCNEIAVPATGNLTLGNFSATAGQFVVLLFSAKVISGNGAQCVVTGSSQIAGLGQWTSGEWQTVACVSQIATTSSGLAFWVSAVSGASTLRCGGIAAMAFATRREAMEFVNSGVFPI